jgi:hypothetical protein
MEALPNDKIKHCVFENCPEDALTPCHKCGRWFCLDHASDLEPTRYCLDCLKLADTDLEFSPIVDAEGTRHQGKVIRPVGIAFAEIGKLIHEMTDDELQDYIKQYQQNVRDCERNLEHGRIKLGNALYEAGDRQIAKVKRATGEVVFLSKKPAGPRASKQRRSTVKPDESAIIEFMMKNLTPEQLQKIIAKAGKK